MITGSGVALEKTAVCEDRISLHAKAVLSKMLERLPRHDTRVTYNYEGTFYHFLVENEIVYYCLSGEGFQNRTIYGYLAEIKDKFKARFGSDKAYPSKAALTAASCASFAGVLASEAKQFNDNPESDKIGKVREQIEQVKQVMLHNIDTVIERGHKIDMLCDKTNALREEASTFNTNARTLKRKMLMRNIKIGIAIFGLLCILALVISFIACGITFAKCKSSSPPSPTPSPTPTPT